MRTTSQTTEEMMAAIGAMCRRVPAVAPVSAEQAKATRADLDAKFRAGETHMNRDRLGRYTGAVKVATFGGEPVAAELPAFALAAE